MSKGGASLTGLGWLLLAGAIACTAGTPLPTVEPGYTSQGATVQRTVDGDTIVIMTKGASERVRLLGVDTPEVSSKNRPGEYGNITDTDCLDKWGVQAAQFASNLLDGKSIALIVAQPYERDVFGRLLGYVVVKGQDFGALLLEGGYARVLVEYPSTREEKYLQLQSRAMSQRAGLWGCQSAQFAGGEVTTQR